MLLVLALFGLATAGQRAAFAQTLPDADAGQAPPPDAALAPAASPDDASAKETAPSRQEPPAQAPSPVVQTGEQMPVDLMVPDGACHRAGRD